jgi:pilus assembly protein Flp/PilA
MLSLVKRFLQDETGATAVEYGLIAAGISMAIIVALKGVGSQLTATFSAMNSELGSAAK